MNKLLYFMLTLLLTYDVKASIPKLPDEEKLEHLQSQSNLNLEEI